MLLPTLDDVRAAHERVHPVVRHTPLMRHPVLCAETGVELFVKHENHNPTGSFKVRGGLNLIPSLSADERRGVIAATTGNHGLSIAFACQREHVPCTIVVPVGNNPDKNDALRALGANLIEHGRDYDEAREYVEGVQKEKGLRYIHSANEPMLIAGVATYALEIFQDLPDADVILVPIGGGSGACGCAIVRSGLGKSTKIIGVQTERADAFARSWRGGVRVTGNKADTFADGMATRTTFDLTYGILATELDDIVTLSEEELADGVRLALHTTHNLAEGAGAASIIAAKKLGDELRGKKVVAVMSGANIDTKTLRKILS
ncbi:MAG TPA: threonine dehydratase [Vicinamibacterales bacterium]|jgi:threonine dehydratase|nr:threonine dehydratase [Vicinamibacterales bacterium]